MSSRSLRDITVREYMAANLVTFTPETEIFEAIRQLINHGISGAPVTDKLGNIVGILSEKDCLKMALNAAYYDEMGGKVADFMSGKAVTVDVETSIVEVAEMFLNSPFKRYPVLKDNRLVGQISRSDVLKAIEALSTS
jgi:predicted transcriptional regulator